MLLEGLLTSKRDRDLNPGVLIAMQRDEVTCFTYRPCVTARVSLGPRGLAHLCGEE